MSQSKSATLNLLDDLVARAKKAGADAANAVASDTTSLSIRLRLGNTEKLERSEGGDLSLRVFFGTRAATVSSSDRSPKALAELIERAVAMARIVPEDPYAGLAAPDEIARTLPELDLCDPIEPSAAQMLDLTRRAEDAARAVPKVTNSEGADAGWSSSMVATVASNGFAHELRHSGASVAVSAIASDGSGMERDDDWSAAVYLADLRVAEELGASAGRRAVHRLGGRKAPTGQVPVIYDPRVASSLLGHLSGAISGPSIARGTSFLKDLLGKKIMPRAVSVIDEPHKLRGLRSSPCDREGIPNKRCAIVENGVLTTWLLDLRSARQLKLKSTGHGGQSGGASPANLWIQPGAVTAAELIADVKRGLYVTELIGMGVNGITGDYSRGAAGFWIENGEIAWPVSEVTVAGNLKEMFAQMTVANDLVFRSGIDAPTVRIDGMTVAGE
jgi:PmbA protein